MHLDLAAVQVTAEAYCISVAVSLILAVVAIAILLGWLNWLINRWKPSRPKPVAIPAHYFMPFCVCPKCKVEALHWLRAPKEEISWNEMIHLTYMAIAADKLGPIDEHKFSCIRTCYECEFEWGQNTLTDMARA